MDVLRVMHDFKNQTAGSQDRRVTEPVLSLVLSLVSGSKFPSESVAVMRSSDGQFVFCYQLKLKHIR